MVHEIVRTKEPKSLEQTPGQKARLSVISWLLKALGLQDVSPRCVHCWTHLELKKDHLISSIDDYVVKGILYWECPTCEDRTKLAYMYFQNSAWDFF